MFWMTGYAHIGLGNWNEAVKIYQKLLDYFKASPYYDLMAEVECRYRLAYIHYSQAQFKESLEQLGIVLANKDEIKDNDYSEVILKGAEKLKVKIKEEMQKPKG